MFSAMLMLLLAGADVPIVLTANEPPFVSRAACEEWAAQDARRIERAIARMPKAKRPEQWEIRCVPRAPMVES